MSINPSSRENMIAFSKDPKKYVLSVSHKQGVVSINLMKRGMITWIKIHIGGALGLFDQTSVKMQRISGILSQVQSRDIAYCNFENAFLNRQIKFETKHFPLFIPGMVILHFLKLPKSTVQVEDQISKNLNNVCPKAFSSIHTKEEKDEGYFISLQLSGLGIKKKKKASSKIESKNLLNAILLGHASCEKDVKKLASRGYKEIKIHLIPHDRDQISAKIYAL